MRNFTLTGIAGAVLAGGLGLLSTGCVESADGYYGTGWEEGYYGNRIWDNDYGYGWRDRRDWDHHRDWDHRDGWDRHDYADTIGRRNTRISDLQDDGRLNHSARSYAERKASRAADEGIPGAAHREANLREQRIERTGRR